VPHDTTDPNRSVIEEFRAHAGRVGGPFAGATLLLLTTAGARTGRPHTTPVAYTRDAGRLLVFATNAGRPHHPAWYHNLRADPQATIELPALDGRLETLSARAEILPADERDRAYQAQAARNPALARYQSATTRPIPVVALHPLDLSGASGATRARAIAAQLTHHHDALRRALSAARTELDTARVESLGDQLFGHCLEFCHGLAMHHIREDGAFTEFETRFPALVEPLARLRREHVRVAAILAELRTLLEEPTADPAAVRAGLDRLAGDLEEHFAYEEKALQAAG
jgi:deazaflavin-dependent oxidoreductase (nitroreductase family)